MMMTVSSHEIWNIFLEREVIMQVAKILNGQQMGGKRRSAYHYDLWCLKYLPKFKWEALTEEIGTPIFPVLCSFSAATGHLITMQYPHLTLSHCH